MKKEKYLPNFTGTRRGLGLIRKCRHCPNIYEPMMAKQKLCSPCSKTNRYIRKTTPRIDKIDKQPFNCKYFYKDDKGRRFYLKISEIHGYMSFNWN